MNTNRFIQTHRLRLLLVALTLLWIKPIWAQEQVSKVVSSGGGFSAGGNYSNFAVVGGEPVSANFSGGSYSAKAGFIYRTSSALPGLPYLLSIDVVPTDAGIALGGGYFHKGTGVAVSATPNSGYTFVGWSATAGGIAAVNSSATTFNMPGQNVTLTAHFAEEATVPTTYSIGLSVSTVNAGTVTGTGVYVEGTTINLTATPSEGYRFLSWKEGATIVSTAPNFSFAVTKDRDLVAHFALKNYAVTLSALPEGNIGGAAIGGGTFAHGTQVTVKAIANLGFTFEGWKEFDNVVSVDNDYTFTITSNRNLVANFDGNKYSISSSASPVETGTTSGDGEYYEGDIVSLSATPAEDYYFVRWMNGAQQVSVRNPYLFSANEDRNLTAEFAEKWWDDKGDSKETTYLITASVEPLDVGVVLGQGNYPEGAEVTLVASPNEGVNFVKWMEDGSEVSTNATFTFTASEDRNLTAVFDGVTYSITVVSSPEEGGLSSVSNDGTFFADDFASVNADPNSGFDFVNWTLGADGPQLSVNPEYGFTVNAGRHLVANFEEVEQFDLTLSVYPEGAGITSGAGSYLKGANADVSAEPSEGYEFVYWSKGAELISSSLNTSIAMISDLEIEAFFTLKSYSLTYIAGSGGSLSGVTSQTVFHGSDGSSITAIPDPGYQFVDWSDGSTDNPRTDINIRGDFTVTANFAERTYTLTYSAGEGGSVTGELVQSLGYGSDGTPVTAVPNTGYSFTKWSDDVTDNPRTDLNVIDDISVTAEFTINTYMLSYSAGEGGSVSGELQQIVNYGSNGSAVEAIPNSGYTFMKWSDDVTDNPRTDLNVTDDISVTAEFAINTYTLTYLAGEGGSISGSTSQTVNYGSDGSSVEAIADACYQFEEWSDGVTENPRTDLNITGNLSVTAIFIERDIDATVTVLDNTITANNSSATYQWVMCGDENEPIEGATSQSFTPTQSGTFAVIITDNGCSVVSECVTITLTNVGTPVAEELSFRVYPNPSSGAFTISSTFEGDFVVVNSLGQVVQSLQLNRINGLQVQVDGLGAGVYLIVGQNGSQRISQKVVVTR